MNKLETKGMRVLRPHKKPYVMQINAAVHLCWVKLRQKHWLMVSLHGPVCNRPAAVCSVSTVVSPVAVT